MNQIPTLRSIRLRLHGIEAFAPSISSVATEINISTTSLSQAELGRRKLSESTLTRLGKVYGKSLLAMKRAATASGGKR